MRQMPCLACPVSCPREIRQEGDQVRKEGPLSVITYGETKEARP